MNNYVLKNVRVYAENGIIENGFVKYNNTEIVEFGCMGDFQDNTELEIQVPEKSVVIPGMIDVHVHGAGGSDVMDATLKDIEIIADELVKEGTTSFLATTMTQDFEVLKNVLRNIAEYSKNQSAQNAEVIGVHLEGPFINKNRAGAQHPEHILKPSVEKFEELQKSAAGLIKIATIAPEVEGALDMISKLSKDGVVVSLGHSVANCEEAEASFAAGSKQITHFFNGLNPLHHREVGVIGAGLMNDEQFVELIVDGKHVEPNAVKLVFKAKGAEKILLITDSMRAQNLPDGEYELGGQPVFVQNGEAKLACGTLASSVLKMNDAVTNMLKFTGCSLADVVKMTSENQAKHLGVFDRKGSITKGKDADLVVLDENHTVLKTICKGEVAYSVSS